MAFHWDSETSPNSLCLGGQPEIRVVLAKQKPVFCSAGEHPVRFLGTAGDQVVDQDADIGFGSAKREGRLPQDLEAGVGSGHKSLGCRFFITGGAIDLAGKEEAAHPMGLEGGVELGRWTIIVFHGVPRANDLGLLETGDRMDKVVLDFEGQAGRKAVDIIFPRMAAFRFQEELVLLFLGKFHHLIFDRGAIAGPDPFNSAGIHRRLVEIGADDVVRPRGGVGDPAGNLFHVEQIVDEFVEGEKIVRTSCQRLRPKGESWEAVRPRPADRTG